MSTEDYGKALVLENGRTYQYIARISNVNHSAINPINKDKFKPIIEKN